MLIDTNILLEHSLCNCEMIYDCQFHPENYDLVGISTIEGNIQIGNFADSSLKTVKKFEKHHNGTPIRKIRFKDNLMFSVARSIKITDLNTEKVSRKISNGKTKIFSILVADDNLICIGDDKGNFKVWDYRSQKPVHMNLNECDNYISDLDIDSNQRLVYASSGEGTLTAFNIRARRMEKPQSELFDSGFQCVRYAEDKDKIIVGSEDGVINIFNNHQWGNISDRYPIKQNNNGSSSIDCLEILDDEKNCFVLGSSDGTIEIISLFPHRSLKSLVANNVGIESIDVNQITNKIVAVSENRIQLFSYEFLQENKRKRMRTEAGFFADLVPDE